MVGVNRSLHVTFFIPYCIRGHHGLAVGHRLYCAVYHVTFAVPYCIRGPFGVVGGSYFDDYGAYTDSGCDRITKIEVYHDDILHGYVLTGSNFHKMRKCCTLHKRLQELCV